MIVKATLNDIDEIMNIVELATEKMKAEGNVQWDESYPTKDDFKIDISNEELYIYKEGNIIKGIVCINNIEPNGYENLSWRIKDRAIIIHRLVVNLNCRNQGIGTKLINLAEKIAKEKEIKYVKVDTYSTNIKMNSLFEKLGYVFVGETYFRGRAESYYCYDKILNK